MTDKPAVDIRALAQLARMEVSDAEVASLEKEIPNILAFVDVIQNIDVSDVAKNEEHRNVFRDDANPHEGGLFTEDLLNAAPVREGDRIAVKQVITRKK